MILAIPALQSAMAAVDVVVRAWPRPDQAARTRSRWRSGPGANGNEDGAVGSRTGQADLEAERHAHAQTHYVETTR